MESAMILLIAAMAFLSLHLLNHLLSFLIWIYILFLRPPKNLRSYGSWALVTGSTDGIGRAIAFELASKGLNLLLLGRSPDKLRSVSDELSLRFPEVAVETIVIDFAEGDGLDHEGIRRVKEAAERHEIGVVVNNAGMTNIKPLFFHEMEEKTVKDIVKVNVVGLTMVTWAVLPKMLERGRGAVVNIGSGSSSAIPSYPLFATYVGTKAYVEAFSRTLDVEYKKNGIDVQYQIPHYVKTKMVPYLKGASVFSPSPEDFARAAVRRIGYEAVCTPYWSHAVQRWAACFVPDRILNAMRLHASLSTRKAMAKED